MENVYTITPGQESALISRIQELRNKVKLEQGETAGFRFRDDSYILFKIKQRWVTESKKSAQQFLDSLTPEQIDQFIVWGIKDAASADEWYNEKSRRDAIETIEASSANGIIIIANRELEGFIEGANRVLDAILKEIQTTTSSRDLFEFMNALDRLKETIVRLQSKPEFRHAIPEEIDQKIENINQILAHKSLGKDINAWYQLIQDGIEEFINNFDVDILNQELEANLTDKAEIRRHIMQFTRAVSRTIADYEKQFGSTFDPSLKDAFEAKKKELSKSLGLYLGEEKISDKPMDVTTVDSDKLLDLYNEIKGMPDGEEKMNKIKEFERMQRILKGSYNNIKISSRE